MCAMRTAGSISRPCSPRRGSISRHRVGATKACRRRVSRRTARWRSDRARTTTTSKGSSRNSRPGCWRPSTRRGRAGRPVARGRLEHSECAGRGAHIPCRRHILPRHDDSRDGCDSRKHLRLRARALHLGRCAHHVRHAAGHQRKRRSIWRKPARSAITGTVSGDTLALEGGDFATRVTSPAGSVVGGVECSAIRGPITIPECSCC